MKPMVVVVVANYARSKRANLRIGMLKNWLRKLPPGPILSVHYAHPIW